MTPLAYGDTGARYAFDVALGMFGASEWSIRLRSGMNRGGTRKDRGSFFVVIATSVLGVAAAFVIADSVHSAAVNVARWPLFVVGIVIMLLGIGLRQWS